MSYTFFYVIGGDDMYYDQLNKSISSLKRLDIEYKIKILDFDRKLMSSKDIETIHVDKIFDFKTQRHIFYQYKYYVSQQLDTEYGIYLDSDTIICSDKIEETFHKIGNNFGVIPHFLIRNFQQSIDYFGNEFRNQIIKTDYMNQNDMSGSEPFFTGGVFFFHNNQNSLDILKDTFDLHNEYYAKDDTVFNGFFDETFLSTVLNKYSYTNVHGSANHCSANLMPLKIENGILMGKNPQDDDFEEIFVFHGFSDRQILGLDFTGDLQSKIQEMWKV